MRAGRAGEVLFGRNDELGRLDALLSGAERGTGGALLLIGEAGAGKSSLARAAAAMAEARGVAARFGRCLQLEIERPFAGLYDALGAPRAEPDLGISRTVLEAGARAATRFLLRERLIEQTEALTADAPAVLVVEDLHWADSSTLQVLRSLAERATDLGLALVTTARPPRAGTELRRFVDSTPALLPVELAPLDDAHVGALVVRATGARPGARLSSALALASGNPLLVIAALEALEQASALEQRGDVVELAGEVPALQPSAAITSRLHELDTDVLRVLQTAAILGTAVRPSVVASVLGQRTTDLLEPFQQACGAGVLVPEGDAYAFRHELHRAAVLGTVEPPMVAALHLQAARALAATGAPVLDVAEHYAVGAEPGNTEAVTWLQRAAEELVDFAPATALRLIEAAVELSGAAPPHDLLLARVRALAGTGRTAETEALARSLLREGLDAPTEAQLHRELAFSYFVQGRMHESVVEIERYGELAGDTETRGRVLAEIAFGRFVDLDHDGAREMAEAAREEGRRSGDIAAQVGGGGVLCWLEEFSNHFESALARAREITSLASQPHAVHAQIYQPWFIAALVHLEADHFEDLATDNRRGREAALETGFAWSLPGYDAMTAYGLLRTGDHDDAKAVAESTLEYLDGVDGFGVALWCHAFLAQIALHRGDEATTEEHLAIAESHLNTGRAQFGFEQSMIAKARLAERRGDPESALRVLSDTWDVYGGIGVHAGRQALGPDLVRLAAAAGERERVEDVVSALDHGAETSGLPAFRAFATLAAAWRDADPEAAQRATAVLETTGRRPTAAARHADVAALLRSAQRSTEADASARRAVELYRACGADADAAAVAATIKGKRVRLKDRPKFGFESLTRTERQVVELVAEGLSNREIASHLVVSRRTVETHVSAAYRKLEVETRVDLARVALAHG